MTKCGSSSIGEFLRKEVSDWDDEITSASRFKAFSGQRPDWESRYIFWRDLIQKVARHLGVFSISCSQVTNDWFNRGGLTPLCINNVLMLMYDEGYLVQRKDLLDPTVGQLARVFNSAVQLISKMIKSTLVLEEDLIILPILKDKSEEVIKSLSETHWNSCVITMEEFREICGEWRDASNVFSYLYRSSKARYLTNKNNELIEGVKIFLSPAASRGVTVFDHDILHLIWVKQKFQKQIDVIDHNYDTSRRAALASVRSGNKNKARQHVGRMKSSGKSREKCVLLLERVEQVLDVIRSADATKELSEAMRMSARLMKETAVGPEEIQLCLEELEESMDAQRQIHDALEMGVSSSQINDDEDVEEEFKKLEVELLGESPGTGGKAEDQSTMEQVGEAFSSLRIRPVTETGPINLEPG